MLIFLQFSIGTRAVVRSSRHRPFCFQNFVFLLNCNQNFCMPYCCNWITRIFVESSSTFCIFFDDDARDSTSTTSRCFFNDVGHLSFCIRRRLVSLACDWVMSALSVGLLIYSFQSRSAFLPRRSARRHSGVLGLPNIGHQTLPEIWVGFLYREYSLGGWFWIDSNCKNGN